MQTLETRSNPDTPLNVANQYNGNACVGDPNGNFCNWEAAGASFAGTANSVGFSGIVSTVYFDDITLGSSTPGAAANASSVPVPGSLGLLGLGLAGTGLLQGLRPDVFHGSSQGLMISTPASAKSRIFRVTNEHEWARAVAAMMESKANIQIFKPVP